MDKDQIFDNIVNYSAENLVDFIRQGIVTFDELVKEAGADFEPVKRKEVMNMIDSGDNQEWEKVKNARTKDAVQHYLDVFQNGKYRDEARRLKIELEDEERNRIASMERERLAQAQQASIEAEWNLVNKNSKEELNAFIQKYPDSIHVHDAKAKVNSINMAQIMGFDADTLVEKIRIIQTDKTLSTQQKDYKTINEIKNFVNEGRISKDDFLGIIAKDHNVLSAGIVKALIDDAGIDFDATDLLNIGIDRNFLRKMYMGEQAVSLDPPRPLDRIHKQSTEVYFWGIPSSGKSCALGAILSCIASGKSAAISMEPDIGSQGYGYMTKLINLFQEGQICSLMAGTAVTSFYEMGFDVVDDQQIKHPITCIDMAGELIRCMYKANAGDPLNQEEEEMLDTVTRVLGDNRSTSRKMHVFVIEYGAENRLYEGLDQRTYLNGTLAYIKNTGIFKRDTDAIYIMVSKADKARNKAQEEGKPLQQVVVEYIEEIYQGFYNGLRQICRDNEINGGEVERFLFSLGEVCFQNYCRFDSRAANNAVRLIVERSPGERTGKTGFLARMFRG